MTALNIYPLKNQVCTQMQGKEFQCLGVKAESYFVWVIMDDWIIDDCNMDDSMYALESKTEALMRIEELTRYDILEREDIIYPAYSLAELERFWERIEEKSDCEQEHQYRQESSIYTFEKYVYKGQKSIWQMYLNTEHYNYALGIFKHRTHWIAQGLLRLLKEQLIQPEDLKYKSILSKN